MNTSSSDGCDDGPLQLGSGRGIRATAASSARAIAARDVQAGAERRHHVDAGHARQLLGQRLQVGPAHRVGAQVRLRRSPPRWCPAPAARRRRYRRSRGSARPRPCSGSTPARVMPSAASLWISPQNSRRALGSTPAVGSSSSSSSGLGRMQAPSARRCFQPPGQLAGQLPLAALKPQPLDGGARLLGRIGEPVHARHELQVLQDREVLVEAEALRHVADVALDLLALRADVVAERRAAAAVGRQQPAQHAQRGGLAGAVGAEEAVDLAALARAWRGRARPPCRRTTWSALRPRWRSWPLLRRLFAWHGSHLRHGCRATDTGWPTRRSSGFSGIASMRNTSRARSSWL